MKIIFIGTVKFSYKALEKIIECGGDVVGVCTKKESKFNSDYVDLTPLCKKNSIPYMFVDDINAPDTIEWIGSLEPSIIFCFGWSSLIKKELLSLAPMGVLGFHPAKLPQNRGRHPIIWALALGLKSSASTFFFMDEGADSGDILCQQVFEILEDDNAKSIYDRVVDTAIQQIEDFLPDLSNGEYLCSVQDHSKANTWRKRDKSDGEIDFRMSSQAIYNLIRSLNEPYVGAHVCYNNSDVVILESEIVECDLDNIESGKVLESCDKYILVKTYDGAIKFTKHDFLSLPLVGEYLCAVYGGFNA